jgi:hypothetical protein
LSFSIQYDIFIIIGLTFLLGKLIQGLILKKICQRTWVEKIFPYALAYFPLALIYSFISNELPLRGFSIDPIYDSTSSTNLGPQSINREGLIAMVIVIFSTTINIVIWAISVFIIIRQLFKIKKQENC